MQTIVLEDKKQPYEKSKKQQQKLNENAKRNVQHKINIFIGI